MSASQAQKIVSFTIDLKMDHCCLKQFRLYQRFSTFCGLLSPSRDFQEQWPTFHQHFLSVLDSWCLQPSAGFKWT